MHCVEGNVSLTMSLGVYAGVEKPVICDMYENKVTVTATAIPDDVLYNVQKVKKDAEFWPKK